jgi:hypothetical protein
MESTFDELRTCPICHELGSAAGVDAGPNRSAFYKFVCENPKCRWYHDAPWLRQRRADGSWVEEQRHQKQFPIIPDRTEEVQEFVDRDLRRQLGQN